jgi:hypothetical protein
MSAPTMFREDELVTRRMNGQSRIFPVVGGRLRLAHEENEQLGIASEMVSWDGQYAIFRCAATTSKGQFVGYGTANAQRDTRLADSLIELAETRSIARALRFAGYGMEFTSLEEVLHVPDSESTERPNWSRRSESARSGGNGNGERKPGPPNRGNGRATQAQVRALHALSRKAQYQEEDISSLIAPFEVSRFEDLPKEAASQVITYLQTEVAS